MTSSIESFLSSVVPLWASPQPTLPLEETSSWWKKKPESFFFARMGHTYDSHLSGRSRTAILETIQHNRHQIQSQQVLTYSIRIVDDDSISGWNQTAFCMILRGDSETPTTTVDDICIWFPGNGMLALEWIPIILATTRRRVAKPSRTVACLLIDYPGQGGCQGIPSPASVLTSVREALQVMAFVTAPTLLRRPRSSPMSFSQLLERTSVVGYSLGCALATHIAVWLRIGGTVVLVAPFTNSHDITNYHLGIRWKPLQWLIQRCVPTSFLPPMDPNTQLLEWLRFHPRATTHEATHEGEKPLVQIWYAKEDVVCPPPATVLLNGRHPAIKATILPNTDHLTIITHPSVLRSLSPS